MRIFPRPRQHLLLSLFLIAGILQDVRWYLTVVLCIPLIANDVEFLFMQIHLRTIFPDCALGLILAYRSFLHFSILWYLGRLGIFKPSSSWLVFI